MLWQTISPNRKRRSSKHFQMVCKNDRGRGEFISVLRMSLPITSLFGGCRKSQHRILSLGERAGRGAINQCLTLFIPLTPTLSRGRRSLYDPHPMKGTVRITAVWLLRTINSSDNGIGMSVAAPRALYNHRGRNLQAFVKPVC